MFFALNFILPKNLNNKNFIIKIEINIRKSQIL